MKFASMLALAVAACVVAACGDTSGETAGGAAASSGGHAGSGSGGTGGGGAGFGGQASGGNGSGGFDVGDSGPRDGENGYCGSALTGKIRDFQDTHPDFESALGSDPGIVEAALGADRKPVYAHGANPTATVHGRDTFDQWYRDVSGVNQSKPLVLQLTDMGGGVFTFQDDDFFPIDGELFGNQGRDHNFHFTYELHTKFVYRGGEVFTFTGDDDLFTFINGRLAIDLGGVHGAQTSSVDLDARAGELGLSVGGTYELEVFAAERHTSESHFRIDTTIASFVDCGGTIY
ncbi:MAG: fibro-slime domain-containing protein [Sorangiineae bacterium]|nr:fibro-slime domain-containing protein [Polyangiaceae bacterium]MEB2321018.1 fibro-slime domain-containing protein [Sorangiineae bacterium]